MDAIESIRLALDADVLLLSRREASRGEILSSYQSQLDPVAHEKYLSGHFAEDPWTIPFCRRVTSDTRLSQEIIPDRDLVNTAYFNDFLAQTKIRYGLFSVSGRNNSTIDALSFLRYNTSNEFTRSEKHKSQFIYQTLQSISNIYLNNAHSSLMLDCYNLALSFDGKIVFVLTTAGRVLCMSESAEMLLQRGGLIRERGNILYGAGPNKPSILVDACVSLINEKVAKKEFLLHHTNTRLPYIAEVRIVRSNHSSSRAILLSIADPNNERAPCPTRIGKVFGLTKRESEIAHSLYIGKEVNEIAEQHQVASDTVRKQLKSIFFKTNTRSQSKLIRLISMIQ